ncbi:IgGFc-binding protein-like [Amphiura filiformis]|uniref:IgGFc-binding protein-like n=1 Tax=Amphiura filiformis TaxID=82378 RepID=UPI003B22840B
MVFIHGFILREQFASGFLILPTKALDTEYIAVSYHRNETTDYWLPAFDVMALFDNTTVTIQTSVQDVRVLQRYEFFHYIPSDDEPLDITGIRLTATRPISLMAGHECSIIPGPTGKCDSLLKHIPPVSSLGHHFVLAPFLARSTGYLFRVIATASDTTQVTISGQTGERLLLSGEFLELNLATDEVVTVSADRPVMVTQYAKSDNADIGDGTMVIIPPTEAFSSNVTFPVPHLSEPSRIPGQEAFITIITACENTERAPFFLDNQPLNAQNASLLQTPDNDYCVIGTSVIPGPAHTVTHPTSDATFLVLVYDFTYAAGYGFVAGYNIRTAQDFDYEFLPTGNLCKRDLSQYTSLYMIYLVNKYHTEKKFLDS